jgi:hypothetical protein
MEHFLKINKQVYPSICDLRVWEQPIFFYNVMQNQKKFERRKRRKLLRRVLTCKVKLEYKSLHAPFDLNSFDFFHLAT